MTLNVVEIPAEFFFPECPHCGRILDEIGEDQKVSVRYFRDEDGNYHYGKEVDSEGDGLWCPYCLKSLPDSFYGRVELW